MSKYSKLEKELNEKNYSEVCDFIKKGVEIGEITKGQGSYLKARYADKFNHHPNMNDFNRAINIAIGGVTVAAGLAAAYVAYVKFVKSFLENIIK